MRSMPKMRSLVRESWRGSPFTKLVRRTSSASISSAVTSHGPVGQKPGALLPFDHWPPDTASCQSRSERSFAMT